MSNNFCSYVDEAHDLKLRLTGASDSEEEGGVEDMLSAPYFGSMERPMPPTFGTPEGESDEEEQKM